MPTTNYSKGFPDGVTIHEHPYVDTQNANGNVYWVDGNKNPNNNTYAKGTFIEPFGTIDTAVGRCTANQGDKIYVAAGHTETVTAAGGLDLDVAGITIVFLGNDANRARVNFTTATTADMDVDAANITLVNPRFTAGIDALAGPIDVNAANFTIINGEYYDGTSIDTTDCIVADANATSLKIHGWYYEPGDEAGTQKQSNIQLNGVDNCQLWGIYIAGDFATGNVENVTDEILNANLRFWYIKNTNSSPTPGLALDVNATGYADNLNIRIASGTSFVSSTGQMNWSNTCLGYNTGGNVGQLIGSGAATTEAAGEILLVQKTLTSSAILQAGVDITGTATGTLLIEDVVMSTDSTGLATGTNFTIESDNANGVAVFFAETVANLGANKTESLATGSVTSISGVVIENGKKLIAKSTVADCTGAGTITLTMKFRRVTAEATIAAA